MLWHIFRRTLCSVADAKMPVKILNVAEKNDAAKSLAEVMSRGRFRRREGLSKFNKIYEFEFNLLNQNCTMVMTSVSGHLLTIDFGGQYRKWNSCDPVTLFDVPIEKKCLENYQPILRTLEREVRGCQKLVIWTDCDREGENIGFEIIQVCKNIKPNIPVYRARFSEITPGAVTRACNNLIPPDENVSNAVDVRQELDLRIGASFTRFQTLRLQKVFPNVLSEQLVSYGSCQFPTLGFVVERYKQVQKFIREQFWKIKVTHLTEDGEVDFSWKRVRTFDHTACLVLYQICLEDPNATVVDVKGKNKSKWRPVALDTVEMEKLASRKLRISAKETMKIAENLYTKGFISYPRTETNIFPKDMDFNTLIQNQTQDPNWGAFAANLLQQGPNPRNGKKTDQAHPPIHPTKYTDTLQGNDKKIYEFIVRHFLACCSQDAQGFETTVEIDIANERFIASGLMITARNYLDVYPYDKWSDKVMPVFEKGQTFQPSRIEMLEGETSPPGLLTEADLIALMEKHGIGTDATHAEHIETIKSRMYVGVRPDGRFVPGELGMGLVEGYDDMGFNMSKPHLRAELEADLVKVCQGRKNKDVVLAEQVQKYKQVFIEAVSQATKIDEALQTYFGEEKQEVHQNDIYPTFTQPVRKCPKCGSDMTIKTKKDGQGYYMSCMGFPDCRAVVWFPNAVCEASVDKSVCNTCQPGPVHRIRFKFRKGYVPPTIPLEHIACIGCDEDLCQVLGIQMKFNSPPGNNNRTASRTNKSNLTRTTTSASSQTRRSVTTNSSNVTNRTSANKVTISNFMSTNPQPRTGGHTNTNIKLGSSNSLPRQNNGISQGGFNNYSPGNAAGQTSGFGDNSRNVQRPPLTSLAQNKSTFSKDETQDIVCLCGEDALLLTVRKEGPNTGRQFYKCSKPQGEGCNFFLWADQSPSGSSGSGEPAQWRQPGQSNKISHSASSNFNQHSNSDMDGSSVVCGCGQPSKLLTVSKEGPNKDRQFHSCAKGRGQGCSFFQWADANDTGGNSYGAANSRKQSWSSNKDGTNTTKRKRKCGHCKQEGHTIKTCPNK